MAQEVVVRVQLDTSSVDAGLQDLEGRLQGIVGPRGGVTKTGGGGQGARTAAGAGVVPEPSEKTMKKGDASFLDMLGGKMGLAQLGVMAAGVTTAIGMAKAGMNYLANLTDPMMTDAQRQRSLIGGAVGSIPLIGGPLQGIYESWTRQDAARDQMVVGSLEQENVTRAMMGVGPLGGEELRDTLRSLSMTADAVWRAKTSAREGANLLNAGLINGRVNDSYAHGGMMGASGRDVVQQSVSAREE